MPKQELQEQTEHRSIAERFECEGECVLVRRIDVEDEKTPGGVIKPEIARLRSNRGEVVAVGEGRVIGGMWLPMNLKEGDKVRFSRYGGTEVPLDDETLLLLHWKQIYLREKCADPPSD